MAQEQTAFAPKAAFEDPDSLGTISVSDDTEINVREAVEAGGGYIVTDDPKVVAALDKYEALKRVSVSEASGGTEKSSPKTAKGSKASSDKDNS